MAIVDHQDFNTIRTRHGPVIKGSWLVGAAITLAVCLVVGEARAQARLPERSSGTQQTVQTPAAPRSARAKLPPGVLAPGDPPLTESMISEMADALGRAAGSPLTVAETNRLRQRAVARWGQGPAYQELIRAAHERLGKEAERVATFPATAQEAAWRQSEEALRVEAMAHPETFLAEALGRARSVAYEELVPGDPPLRKNAAQAYYEMRDFIDDLARGRATQPSTTEVLRGGVAVAQFYAQSAAETRRLIAAADRAWALVRANWAALGQAERASISARAASLLERPGAVALSGELTPATIATFLQETGLSAPRQGFYWSVKP